MDNFRNFNSTENRISSDQSSTFNSSENNNNYNPNINTLNGFTKQAMENRDKNKEKSKLNNDELRNINNFLNLNDDNNNNLNLDNFMKNENINYSNNNQINKNNDNNINYTLKETKNGSYNGSTDLDQRIKVQIDKIRNELEYRFIKNRKIGLKGRDNCDDSYLNSLIQCLGTIPDILVYFQKNIKFINNPKEYPLTFSFFRLIEHLYPYIIEGNYSFYSTNKFLKIIEHCFPFLRNNKNPIDLYHLLMHDIHDEINNIKKDKIEQKIINVKEITEVINNSINLYKKNNNSIISEIFNIFYNKEIKCNSCQNIFYEMQHYISFDLDIINTYKNLQKNNLTINDCLNNFVKPVFIKRICCLCGKISQLEVKKDIFITSNILVFIVSRNNENEKNIFNNIKLNYEKILNIDKYLNKKSINKSSKFLLIGVVAYLSNGNKFVSYCKNLFSNEWIFFNDEKINSCQYEDMINTSTPYILFYKMIE